MTEVERLKIQADQQQAIEAAGDKISGRPRLANDAGGAPR